jgi:hypothetical protein
MIASLQISADKCAVAPATSRNGQSTVVRKPNPRFDFSPDKGETAHSSLQRPLTIRYSMLQRLT